MDWSTRWRIRQYVARSLWPVPAAIALSGLAAGLVLAGLDRGHPAILIDFDAGTARHLLTAIARAMITFTGFVFAVLVLFVQIGAGRFSPRLLDWFLHRAAPKVALGVYMASFLYALAVLRVVGTGPDPDRPPSNAVALAIVLTLASGAMFLLLVSRSIHGLRVGGVLRHLARRGAAMIDAAYPRCEVGAVQRDEPAGTDPNRVVLYQGDGGYLEGLDERGLAESAARAGVVIELVVPIGAFLAPGTPLLVVHGDGGIDEHRVRRSIAVGNERVLAGDPGAAVRAFADIANKARPRGSDPTTAIQVLDHLERLLLLLVPHLPLGERVERDRRGVIRLVLPTPSWEDYIGLAFDEIRHTAAGSPQVIRRLRALLTDLRRAVPAEFAGPLWDRLELLDAAANREFAAGRRQRALECDRQGLGHAREPTATDRTASHRA